MELQEKEEKIKRMQESCIERTLSKRCLLSLDLKTIIKHSQEKGKYCRQRIPEFLLTLTSL